MLIAQKLMRPVMLLSAYISHASRMEICTCRTISSTWPLRGYSEAESRPDLEHLTLLLLSQQTLPFLFLPPAVARPAATISAAVVRCAHPALTTELDT